MTKTSTRLLSATVAAIMALGTASAVMAQQDSQPGQRMEQGMHKDMHKRMRDGQHERGKGRHAPMTAEAVAQRLDKVKADLAITPEQEAAWNQFANVARTQAAERQAWREQMKARMADGNKPSADERKALREQMKTQREAARSTREQARDALYAVLTPGQKALANQQLRQREGHRPGGDGDQRGHRHGDRAGQGSGQTS